jgi:hypothetical protein
VVLERLIKLLDEFSHLPIEAFDSDFRWNLVSPPNEMQAVTPAMASFAGRAQSAVELRVAENTAMGVETITAFKSTAP